MADPNPPGAPNIDSITGPVMLGQVAAVMMYGVLLSEFNAYCHSPGWRRSSRAMQSAVVAVMLTVTGHMGLAVHDLFYYGTLPTADLEFILQGTLPQAVEPITAGVIAFAVEILLLVRVLNVLPHPLVRWTFCALVVVGASTGLLGACMYGAIGIKWHNEDFANWPWYWDAWYSMWLWSVAAVDVLITSVYIWALCKRLSGGTELRQSVLRLLVVAAVRTAAYTAILASVAAILGETWGLDDPYTNLICYAFWEPLPPLYALSLFTTLSVADNVVARLGDPTLRKHGDDKADESVLPRFAPGGLGTATTTTGGVGGVSFGATSWAAIASCGGGESASPGGLALKLEEAEDDEVGLEVGPNGLVRHVSGIFVQVETVERDERDPLV